MQKIVINRCFGGFGLTDLVLNAYRLKTGKEWDGDRTDPELIKIIEQFGSASSSDEYAEIKIVEIPDGVKWRIEEYDGCESIHEVHRVWE